MFNNKSTHKFALVVGAAGVLAALVGVTVMDSAAAKPRPSLVRTGRSAPNSRGGQASLQTQSINRRLRNAFLIFRQRSSARTSHASSQQTAALKNEVPTILHYWEDGHASTILGNTAGANGEMITTASGIPLFVLGGTKGACLATLADRGGYVAACGFAAAVSTNGLGLQQTGTNEIVGIVPDGNKSVQVVLASGEHVSAPVTSNAFALTADSLPVKATYLSSTGTSTSMQASP